MRRADAAQLRADRGKQQLVAEDLDRTGSRARTAANQSDEEKQRNGKTAPLHIVNRGIAGARNDGGDIEKRLAEGLFVAHVDV